MAKDPIEALNVLKASGVDRILTSGQQNSAINGATLIRDLIAKAGDELIIMPGGGITVENINQVMRMTGALEYHATLRNTFDGSMRFRRTGISMSGGSNEDEFSIRETDPMLVKQCVNKLNNKMNKKTYPMKRPPYKLGLVLGGGGARGFAHLGVTRALYEHDIKPDIISGVSAGSIVGAFLAAGLNPAEVFELLRDQDIMKITNIHLPKDGLLKLADCKSNSSSISRLKR